MSTWTAIVLAVLPKTASIQDTPVRVPSEAEPQAAVRMELTGPALPTHVWAASEWTLRFENQALVGFPFDPILLEPSGWGGAFVYFEISKEGQPVRKSRSRNFGRMSTNCFSPAKGSLLKPGGSAELPLVLHGEMVLDLAAYGRDEKVDTRFVPDFDSPGAYTVTAVLQWKGATARSNPVKIEVADAPAGAEEALAKLKELVADGICIDVQGVSHKDPSSLVERVVDFVEREKHTLYGAQMQIGLAEASLSMYRGRMDGISSQPPGVDPDLERAKRLLAQEPPMEYGLGRMFRRLRAELSTEEAGAK